MLKLPLTEEKVKKTFDIPIALLRLLGVKLRKMLLGKYKLIINSVRIKLSQHNISCKHSAVSLLLMADIALRARALGMHAKGKSS